MALKDVIQTGSGTPPAGNTLVTGGVATDPGNEKLYVKKADGSFYEVGSSSAHIADKSNPHEVTADQVGLGNVDNVSVQDMGVSDAVALELAGRVKILTSPITITVGTGGDYNTLRDAIFAASEYRISIDGFNYAVYPLCTINILSGHVVDDEGGILLKSIDLSGWEITSVDQYVNVSTFDLFVCVDSIMPLVSTLFKNTLTGTLTSAIQLFNSKVRISAGKGIAGGFSTGIEAHSSSMVSAHSAYIYGCLNYSLSISTATVVDISHASCRLDGTDANPNGTSDNANDIEVTSGGIVSAAGGYGGSNLTPNTISADGILFK